VLGDAFRGQRIIDMFGFHRFTRRLTAGAAAFAVTFAPFAARAQDDVPSYARPSVVSTDETIHGRIRSVDGAFTIAVDDDRGFIDSVELHQGTIINPTGLTLSPGMSVTIVGFNAGDAFDANEIDTPYSYDGPLPTPAYYGPGYWCPGFAYGYGPSFSLDIIIGGGRPWYYEHRPFRGRPWDGRRYFGAEIARGAEPQVRLEHRRPVGAPVSHAPAAFAGRSFAGESRNAPDRFGTASTSTAPASGRRYEETRGNAAGYRFEHSVQSAHGPSSERGGGAARSGGGSRHEGGGGAHAHAHAH
jgi:hypothetical protein